MRFVQLEHSLFALPFGLAAAALAAGGWFGWERFGWIVLALVAGRTFGMAMNRILDRRYDAMNPRTQDRPFLTGEVTLFQAWAVVWISVVLLIFAAWMLNPLCLKLSPLALLALGLYPFAKRFTWRTHFSLGFCYFLMAVGCWIAVDPGLAGPGGKAAMFSLAAAAGLWVAGFDILYSLQDMEFDRRVGLHSIPARFGVERALWISRFCHAGTLLGLALAGYFAGLGGIWWTGWLLLAGMFFWQHSLVRPNDLSRVNRAFFTANAWISFVILLAVGADLAMQ